MAPTAVSSSAPWTSPATAVCRTPNVYQMESPMVATAATTSTPRMIFMLQPWLETVLETDERRHLCPDPRLVQLELQIEGDQHGARDIRLEAERAAHHVQGGGAERDIAERLRRRFGRRE